MIINPIKKTKRSASLFSMAVLLLFAMLLSGCSLLGLGQKSNLKPPAPLVAFQPQLQMQKLWSTRTGSGSGNKAIKLLPILANNTLYTADAYGVITSIDSRNGRQNWRINTRTAITSGPAADSGLVVVATENGQVIAVQAKNGSPAWHANVGNEVLAAPKIARGVVLIKTISGRLVAFDASTGQQRWVYNHTSPMFTLRGDSVPAVANGKVVVGFADGQLTALSLQNGRVLWNRTIATPKGAIGIERLVDIDANPHIVGNTVYTVTYQGNVAAVSLRAGKIIWKHGLSAYTGLAVGAYHIFVSDADSHLWAFDRYDGTIDWRNTRLDSRTITAPVLMESDIVVGDSKGYLHWMASKDGHFTGRVRVANSAIIANPVVSGRIIYALTAGGTLTAYLVAPNPRNR